LRAKKNGSYETERYLESSKINIKKASLTNIGRKHSKEWRSNQSKGVKNFYKNLSKQDKEDMLKDIRTRKCKTYKLIDETRKPYITNHVSKFCLDHELPLGTVIIIGKTNTQAKKGKLKNWKVFVIEN